MSENLRFKQIKYTTKDNGKLCAIATLQLLPDSKTNEARINVSHANALHAKYRTNKAKVIKIENEAGIDIKEGFSAHSEDFKYVVGEVVESEFNNDINDVCTHGIHYFKTKEQAQWWLTRPHNGEYKQYYGNGQIEIHCSYHNGVLDGEFKYYSRGGQIQMIKHYKDGLAHGEFKYYSRNGHIEEERFYKEGELVEEYSPSNTQLDSFCFNVFI